MLYVKLVMDFVNVSAKQMVEEVFSPEGRKKWEQEMPMKKVVKQADDYSELYIQMPKPSMFIS